MFFSISPFEKGGLGGISTAYAEQKKKTIFTPKTKEPPAEKGIEAPKKGVSGWWYVLGIVVIGSAAAASAASSQTREKKRPTLE
jgi:hypothetical protein